MKLLLLATGLLLAESATANVLIWDAVPGAVHYRVLAGPEAGQYNTVALVDGAAFNLPYTGGLQHYVITTLDAAGGESEYSVDFPYTPAPFAGLRAPPISVFWTTNFPGYHAQWASTPAGPWTDVAGPVTVVGSSFQQNDSTTDPARFYRLKK